MNVVPKDINVCPHQCTDPDTVHHHPIEGAPDWHEGALVACTTNHCIVKVAFIMREEAEPIDVPACLLIGCKMAVPHHHVHNGPDDIDTHKGTGDERTCFRCQQEQVRLDAQKVDQERLVGDREALIQETLKITDWWVQTSMKDAELTAPKAVEYGAVDFDIMGQFMVALVADKLVGADDAEKARVGREMAVTFYLLGKLGRMVGAYATGVAPSDDTLFDTTIYSMMLRRIRETGKWVG